MEARRASNGLVKIISGKVASAADQPTQTASSCISPLTVLGQSLHASVLPPIGRSEWLRGLGGTALEFKAEHVSTPCAACPRWYQVT